MDGLDMKEIAKECYGEDGKFDWELYQSYCDANNYWGEEGE